MERLRALISTRPKGRSESPPWDNWSGRIRAHIYALVRRYRVQGRLKIIRQLVSGLVNEPLKVSFHANPFYWALYAARNDADLTILSYKDISRFAAQMLYADRHDIDPELLIGFIYQQGGEDALKRKLDQGASEPWLADYRARRFAKPNW